MPRTIDFSRRTAGQVLKDRDLKDEATVEELAQAAEAHDLHNKGYLSRDELERGASHLAAELGHGDAEERDGLAYSRQLLDRAKANLGEAGIWVTDAQLRRVLAHLDSGDGQVSLGDLNRAVRMIREVTRLEEIDAVTPPARPAAQAQAEGATADLGRRKLAEGYAYTGQGPVKVAFFDADSTLRVSKSGSVSANGPRDVALLPFVARRLRELSEQGFLIAVVSNQSGVRYGHVTMADADEALQHTADLIRATGGVVDYVDFAEAAGPDRKPNTGMADRLEAMLVDTFGVDAKIDRDASFMCGDSAYKRSDTRPDGRPGSNFSNSDRLFADNAGLRFEEPTHTFDWAAYGVPQIDNIDALREICAPFDVGSRSKKSPLFARFQDLGATGADVDAGRPLPAALAHKVRWLAGEMLPELDDGNAGLQGFLLEGGAAERLLEVARGWRMADALRDDAAAVGFDPDRHAVLACLETWDEPVLSVYVVDRATQALTQVGVDMSFVDGTDDLLARLVPESHVAADGCCDGFEALYQLLHGAAPLELGGPGDGIDPDWRIDDFHRGD